MNVLLDTQAFLWLNSAQAKISASARQICSDANNILWLSVVSVWEMQIKIALGKMRLRCPLAELIAGQQKTNGIQILPLNLPHAMELQNLPPHRVGFRSSLVKSQSSTSDECTQQMRLALQTF